MELGYVSFRMGGLLTSSSETTLNYLRQYIEGWDQENVKVNPKSQASNYKWFDKPFDRLTVLSRVEGLTTLSPVEG